MSVRAMPSAVPLWSPTRPPGQVSQREGVSQKSGYTSPKDVKGPLRKGRGQASMMREKYTHVLQGSHFIESNLTSKKKITQICKLLSLPLGRKLVFFKTGWNQVVPDASKTTYVKAPG